MNIIDADGHIVEKDARHHIDGGGAALIDGLVRVAHEIARRRWHWHPFGAALGVDRMSPDSDDGCR